MNQKKVETIFIKNGIDDFRWIPGKEVQVRRWVRFKCMFGCDSYGSKGCCPPEVPGIDECREFFGEYDHVAVIHLQKKLANPDDRKAWSCKTNRDLLKLEKEVFLAGHHKALLLFMDECRLCADCTGKRGKCKNMKMARPGPESLGVDVFGTVRSLGLPIEVLTDYDKVMNRYAFLLVD